MAEINTTVKIEKLEAKVKIVEEKEEGIVVDRHLITAVTLEYEGTPARLEGVLFALRSAQRVDVTFGSPQSTLDEVKEEKEVATVP